MRVAINALAATNLSGRHVLLGHLRNLARWTADRHSIDVLYHETNADLVCDLGSHVKWLRCPAYTGRWQGRAYWERTQLPRLLSRRNADFMLTTSGGIVPGLGIPQVSYAQNPLPLVATVSRGPLAQFKTALQRRAFAMAMRDASMMFFLSEHLRRLYRDGTGKVERASEILYVGLDEETFASAEQLPPHIQRQPHRILSVSVMAPHKEIETVIRAVHRLRTREELPLELDIVGPWSDAGYEQATRRLAKDLGLNGAVRITGAVDRERLHRFYAEASLFCLMSRAESFGIPALEAQAFGTPVLSSNSCAAPEICGDGGMYASPGDVDRVAELMGEIVTDRAAWGTLSQAARVNAGRFHWRDCSRPILSMFDAVNGTQ